LSNFEASKVEVAGSAMGVPEYGELVVWAATGIAPAPHTITASANGVFFSCIETSLLLRVAYLNETVVTQKQTPCHESNYIVDQRLSYNYVVFSMTVFVGMRRHALRSEKQIIVFEPYLDVAEQRRAGPRGDNSLLVKN
jgi:hypothetical protein